MQVLFDEILRRLRGSDQTEVYPSFDAVPVGKKSAALFTVLTAESVKLGTPFPEGACVCCPFSAVFTVSVLVPMTSPLETAEDHFYDRLLPRMRGIGCVLCEVRAARVDVKLGRIIMDARFTVSGISMEVVSA
ncbi:MAG: hypothetical protein II916_05450 [Oscillospiraceae bacterium]|nr:hypothetical protein [Oscillospiraceae bacterium]